jgi:hypothetical protein
MSLNYKRNLREIRRLNAMNNSNSMSKTVMNKICGLGEN